MSEFGKLRQQDNSGDAISAGAIIHELDLVNKLLARAEKAEAALESAQKMADHWENKTAYWKLLAKETETARSRSILLGQMESILNAVDVETRHPSNEVGERNPMTLGKWVQWMVKSRHEWRRIARENEARAEKAEAERDELRTNGAIRPEPSRLEIAKDILCAWEGVDCVVRNPCIEALRLADELIAAAKEVQG